MISPRRREEGRDPPRWTETYSELRLNTDSDSDDGGYPAVCCLLEITALVDRFARLVKT